MKQQQKQHRRKKRRVSRATPPPARAPTRPQRNDRGIIEEERIKNQNLAVLLEAFEGISIESATSAIDEANGDVDRAAEILSNATENSTDPNWEDPFWSSVSDSNWGTWSSSSSSSNSTCTERGIDREGYNRKMKKKGTVVAVTGTVGGVIGKEYVNKSGTRRRGGSEECEKGKEQFLCGILGEDCELSLAVVRDVLCQCGYNVDKALDTLLDLCASSSKSDDKRLVTERWAISNGAFDSASRSSETEFDDNIWGYDYRNYSQVLTGKEAPPNAASRNDKASLPQEVLESLFNIQKSSEHEPDTMNWRNVIKKMQSLGPGDVCPSSDPLPQQEICAKGDEYHLFRQSATQHWDSMKSCYQKAAVAYSKGQRDYAGYLSDKGRLQTKMAREADEKASRDIFQARNKDIENVVTIDLHGQHVKQAMKVLKMHLVFGTYARSIQILRVITGCGSHGLGKSKLKQSVIKLLEKEGIQWKEENQGTVLIKLDGYKEYSFLNSDGDSD